MSLTTAQPGKDPPGVPVCGPGGRTCISRCNPGTPLFIRIVKNNVNVNIKINNKLAVLQINVDYLPFSYDADETPCVCYSIREMEDPSEAVVNAFMATNVDVFDRETRLQDWIETDALDGMDWSSDVPLVLQTRIWERPVTITDEEVRIYGDANGR